MMWSQLPNEDACGAKRDDHMLASLTLPAIFIAGFFSGYAVRFWRSEGRRSNHAMSRRGESGSRASMFGHARRAF
jgi:hypothetical protein